MTATQERALSLLRRDLEGNLNWTITRDGATGTLGARPPDCYQKKAVREMMAYKRDERLHRDADWIERHLPLARLNLADGRDALASDIAPVVEVVDDDESRALFRILRYYWSSPWSEYVGRRMKLIVRDAALPTRPVIGIAALGSPIIHIPQRDEFIGWDRTRRTERLNDTADAYIVGALPPYNDLLGGKLVATLLASRELRETWQNRYAGRERSHLAAIFTTSLFGRSSQYNRLRHPGRLLWRQIGETSGYGSQHLTVETVAAMRDYLASHGIRPGNDFGNGPSWTMRLVRQAVGLLGFDGDQILRHGIRRHIYYAAHADNCLEYLRGETDTLEPYQHGQDELVDHWHRRWLHRRRKRPEVVERVQKINRKAFTIFSKSERPRIRQQEFAEFSTP